MTIQFLVMILEHYKIAQADEFEVSMINKPLEALSFGSCKTAIGWAAVDDRIDSVLSHGLMGCQE